MSFGEITGNSTEGGTRPGYSTEPSGFRSTVGRTSLRVSVSTLSLDIGTQVREARVSEGRRTVIRKYALKRICSLICGDKIEILADGGETNLTTSLHFIDPDHIKRC